MTTTSLLTLTLKISLIIATIWVIWFIFLRSVTRFSAIRAFIVLSVTTAIISPWLMPILQPLLGISGLVNETPLTITIPEVTISNVANSSFPWIKLLAIIYISVCSFFLLRFIYQLIKIAKLFHKSNIYRNGSLRIAEHTNDISPFSFFNLCFINSANISSIKIEEILKHEKAHITKRHSVDIVLFELIGITQWFNPFFWMLRKTLVEIHEYQADRDVIKTQTDPHSYLDTIISVAFNGIALPIGNNLNKSLTLKRLAMMTTTKKTKGTAFRIAAALLVALPTVFAISCNNNEIIPTANEEDTAVVITNSENSTQKSVDDDVFVIVENMPTFQGGNLNKFREYINENLIYPEIAAQNGIQGRVIVSFIVEVDGSVSNIKVLRGVDPSLDKEVCRAIEASPKWEAGKQRGEKVRVTFNMPIIFTLE